LLPGQAVAPRVLLPGDQSGGKGRLFGQFILDGRLGSPDSTTFSKLSARRDPSAQRSRSPAVWLSPTIGRLEGIAESRRSERVAICDAEEQDLSTGKKNAPQKRSVSQGLTSGILRRLVPPRKIPFQINVWFFCWTDPMQQVQDPAVGAFPVPEHC
jgi:hypothetical protein